MIYHTFDLVMSFLFANMNCLNSSASAFNLSSFGVGSEEKKSLAL